MKHPPPAKSRIARLGLAAALGACLAAAAFAAEYAIEPQYSAVLPGLDYAHIRVKEVPWSIHVARLDCSRTDFEILSPHAQGVVHGVAPLSAQVKALRAARLCPVAAINGDYFAMDSGPCQGDPTGLQIINGELVSTPANTSFWTDNAGRLQIGVIYSEMAVTWPDGAKMPLGLNQMPASNTVVLFTPTFGPATPAANAADVVLEKADPGPWLPLRAGQSYQARVRELKPSGGTRLAPDTAVLAVGTTLAKPLASLKPGSVLRFSTAISKDLANARAGIGGGPTLLLNGVQNDWLSKPNPGEKELPRHPRSAIGFNENHLFLVVVDGRQKSLSAGMTYLEEAALMRQLGCTEAMNLDGGGSSTLWLNGKVVNSPSALRARPLANLLVIVSRDQ